MAHDFDLLIRGGTIVDGSGGKSYRGDVAVRDGWIVAVGEKMEGTAARTIDAKGLLVTPGFVDVHTHYDGQLIWSDRLSPSSEHGVTTVVTGNCGIGFAPCRPKDHEALVHLMEGVEDIPEAVATAGLTWDWESFPEFLDRIAARKHDIDAAAYLPHSPLRVYVMGERAIRRERATPEDIEKMQALAREALEAGALGFGTSRMSFHRSSTGELIPSYDAGEDELHAICDVMRETGKGVFQMVSNFNGDIVEDEMRLMERIARRANRPVTYTQAQTNQDPDQWRDVLKMLERANDGGATIKAQLFPRPVGMIMGLRASANPFCMTPTYLRLKDLPLAEKVAELLKPDVRERILHEAPQDPTNPLITMARNYANMFELDPNTPNYEPDRDENIEARAAAMGVTPAELAYDLLLKHDGRAMLLLALGNYADYNLDFITEMLRDKNVVVGLGDGGAHYGMICDASYPTFALTHWVRDREGERFGLEEMVHLLTRKPAEMVGLLDRGLLAPGHRGNINVIDHEKLKLFSPDIVEDLPGGGRRLHQRAEGYVATILSGEVIAENGKPTGVRVGQLIRGAQRPRAADQALAAE
jgi:N-acyl-D-aspartate/D-glutamate deacylase